MAQSQYNVLSVFGLTLALNLPALFKAVWDYVPRPTSAAAADIRATVNRVTDPKQTTLISKLAGMVKQLYRSLLDKLVALNILRRA